MKHILIDIETYGQIPSVHPLVSFAAICYETKNEFYVEIVPDSPYVIKEAKKVADSGLIWAEEERKTAEEALKWFDRWLMEQMDEMDERCVLVSDSTSFDHSSISYYCWTYLGYNPFGHTSISLSQIFKGMQKNIKVNIRGMRPKGMKNHNALQDCRSNLVVLDKMIDKGLQWVSNES